jgi:hypothetical protein
MTFSTISVHTLLTNPNQRTKTAVSQFTLSVRAAVESDAVNENMIAAFRRVIIR